MQQQQTRFRGWLRKARVGFAVALAVAVVAVAWESTSIDRDEVVAAVDDGAWGAEVFEAIHQNVLDSIIRPANACGLGASSCFRCHNGTRAPAPSTDAATAPWHAQHASVNNSCVGCHNGNPRLMRQEMSHRNLIANPRGKPAETCASCHRANEVDKLLELYNALGS